MEKEKKSAYETIDDCIMYFINKGVRIWNYTTGQTKTDLANQLLGLSPILESTGPFSIDPRAGIFFAIPSLYFTHEQQKENNEIETLEEKAKDKMCLDQLAEYMKNDNCKIAGLVFPCLGSSSWLTTSCFFYSQNKVIESTASLITAIRFGLRGLSYYVMRAEDLPPQKNCVAKTLEKLVETIREYKSQPAPVPLTVKHIN